MIRRVAGVGGPFIRERHSNALEALARLSYTSQPYQSLYAANDVIVTGAENTIGELRQPQD